MLLMSFSVGLCAHAFLGTDAFPGTFITKNRQSPRRSLTRQYAQKKRDVSPLSSSNLLSKADSIMNTLVGAVDGETTRRLVFASSLFAVGSALS